MISSDCSLSQESGDRKRQQKQTKKVKKNQKMKNEEKKFATGSGQFESQFKKHQIVQV